jgi:hypothetical protein
MSSLFKSGKSRHGWFVVTGLQAGYGGLRHPELAGEGGLRQPIPEALAAWRTLSSGR